MTRVGLRGMQLGIPTLRSGAPAPVNTVAPAIPASAVIGTELVTTPGTWNGTYTLTYQWQRNTGSWVDIGGATSANYTPVDADFGRALRVVETADGSVSANSNETGLTAEAPAQSLSAELLVNGDFSAWTGDNPDGWTVFGESGSDPMITEAAGGARFYTSSTALAPRAIQNIAVAGSYYQIQININAVVSGTIRLADGAFAVASDTLSTTGTKRFLGRFTDASLLVYPTLFPSDVTVADVSAKGVTLNTQLTAPAANMRADFFYTLPGSPVTGDTVWLMPRVSNFAAGNYWLVWLRYTGGQWNINLYSVATHTRTSRIAATNIGATNGIRIHAFEDDWSLYTTTDSGDNWTQRGSTITNNTYEANTGVNVLYTSSVTAGNLLYAPAT